MKDRFLIIDGNSLMHRAFWALPQMTDNKQRNTNALFGFLNMFLGLLDNYKPAFLCVAFDKKGKTFRHQFYCDYKAGRIKTPLELTEQFDYIKTILNKIGVTVIEENGYEADDIIGTLSNASNYNNIIITGDRDYLQLVNDNTTVLLTKKGISELECFDVLHLKSVYDLDASQIADLKGLMGDASDNIPGIAGIGEKTALKLLHQYCSVEKLYEEISVMKESKLKEKVIAGKDSAFLSKKLATIDINVPLNYSFFDDFIFTGLKTDVFAEILQDFNFSSILKKYNFKLTSIKNVNIIDINIIELDKLLDSHDNYSILYNGDFHFSFDACTDYVLKVKKDLLSPGVDFSDVMPLLRKYNQKSVIAFDIKSLMHKFNVRFIDYFDCLIASWVLNPVNFPKDIYTMASSYLYPVTSAALFYIKAVLSEEIQNKNLDFILYEIEFPLIYVMYSMEDNGVYVDIEQLDRLRNKYETKLIILKKSIFDYSGHEFNILSTKQLGTVLFDELGLPVIKKTKTGYSTDNEVLEKLEGMHPIITDIKAYRQISKIQSTYVDGLLNQIRNSKIHTTFLQTGTVTGRVSSVEPNLQNIPVKSEFAIDIRKSFFAPDGYDILSADYSQIELRILAHIANDSNMIEAFLSEQDIHARTASEILEKDITLVTDKERSDAKAVNFGIVYGISDFGLAKNSGINVKKAGHYIEKYLNEFSGVRHYMESIKEDAHKCGYVKTLFGRIRFIPELYDKNYNIRSFGERAAMNTPIQGSAADLIKLAMIRIFNELESRKLKSRLVLQVHDELIFYVHKSETEMVSELVSSIMTQIAELSVPLKVNICIGKYWSEVK